MFFSDFPMLQARNLETLNTLEFENFEYQNFWMCEVSENITVRQFWFSTYTLFLSVIGIGLIK